TPTGSRIQRNSSGYGRCCGGGPGPRIAPPACGVLGPRLMTHVLGVIGGSGIYDIPGLEDVREHDLDTPFGKPNDRVVEGNLTHAGQATRLLFLPRHARGHRVSPTHINYRANVCAMKQLGATHLVSLSAVG